MMRPRLAPRAARTAISRDRAVARANSRLATPDGRSGYSPKTERDWKAYYAAKPEDRKRVDKDTRKNIPLTDDALGHSDVWKLHR